MKKSMLFAAGAMAVLTVSPAGAIEAETVNTLPVCPHVTYDGDINGEGPQWEGGEPPLYDCTGSAQEPAEVSSTSTVVTVTVPAPKVDYTPSVAVTVTPTFTG